MRARQPDRDGYVERDGVKVFYEVFGAGAPTILLLPPWSVVHSRTWKMQVPYLARHYRVVTFDGRGNGRSDRPAGRQQLCGRRVRGRRPGGDGRHRDRSRRGRVTVAGCVLLAAPGRRPRRDRVAGQVFICPTTPLAPFSPARLPYARSFEEDSRQRRRAGPRTTPPTGSATTAGFLEFFFAQVFAEPHSTKQIEDAIGWGLDTTAGHAHRHAAGGDPRRRTPTSRPLLDRVRGPCLVIQGSEDAIVGPGAGPAAGRRPRATGPGSSSWPGRATAPMPATRSRSTCSSATSSTGSSPTHGRASPLDPGQGPAQAGPVHLLADRAGTRPPGRGHRRRAAPAPSRPARSTGWPSTQSPPSSRPEANTSIPPRPRWPASRATSRASAAEHDLHCFQAWRRMDEILLANFMVFHDLVEEDPYDLWIGDEAWELDYYLHENPEQKRAAYVWLTDFVGWLPMPDGGAREAYLTADYNAEMIEPHRPLPAGAGPGHLHRGAR